MTFRLLLIAARPLSAIGLAQLLSPLRGCRLLTSRGTHRIEAELQVVDGREADERAVHGAVTDLPAGRGVSLLSVRALGGIT